MEPGRATIGAQMALAWSSVVAVVGVVLFMALPLLLRESEDSYCENGDHPGPCATTAELLAPGTVALAVGAGHLVTAVGFRRGRSWARWAVVATFSAWAVGALAGAAAVVGSPDGLHLGALCLWLVGAGYFAMTAGLVARTGPPVAELAMGPDQGRS